MHEFDLNTYECDLYTHTVTYGCDFYTQCDFDSHECDFHAYECDFDTQECHYDTNECELFKQSVISTRRV
jgi:hypothetical protein